MHTDIVVAGLVPGWSMIGRRRWAGFAVVFAGVVMPVALVAYALYTGRNWVALSLDTGFLGWVVVAGAIAVVARIVALFDLWNAAGCPTRLGPLDMVVATIVTMALGLAAIGVVQVGRARAAIEPAFVSAGPVLFDAEEPLGTSDEPLATAASTTSTTSTTSTIPTRGPSGPAPRIEVTTTTSTTTTLPPLPARPRSGVSRADLADVTNVLLIGGDAGPGRSGLRTDSMMLFSLHRPSGRASLISIPRDLRRLLFPPGSALEARHPHGYDDLANAVYVEVSSSRQLRDHYQAGDVRPGVVALAQGIGYSLDVTIHDYVLVDMQGFLDLVDALGGVTVRVTRSVPMPGNIPGAPTQYPDRIGPGLIEMDGSTALGYVRSRKGDNDYRRASRQRDVLAALATQVSWSDVATSIGDVAAAIGGTLRTSLTPDELADTLSVIGGETAIVESMGLVPPLVNMNRPDYDSLAKIVGSVQVALVTGQPSGY